jgi:hypothetical protein
MNNMYITIKEAAAIICRKNSKNNYNSIINLINMGRIQEAFPDVYFKIGDEFVKQKIKTERLLSLQAVEDYVKNYKNGQGKRIQVRYQDGTKKNFNSIGEACEYLQTSRHVLSKSIKDNKTIEISGRFIRANFL